MDRTMSVKAHGSKADTLVMLACVLALLFLIFGCKAGGSAVPRIVGSVSMGEDPSTKPTVLARYDGNVFVAWASGTATAEVFGAASGFPLFGPIVVEKGTAVVHVRDPEMKWVGDANAALPVEAAALFRDAESDAWGIVFGPLTP